MYINEHDERTILIKDKIAGFGSYLVFGVILISAIASSFINIIVAVTLPIKHTSHYHIL